MDAQITECLEALNKRHINGIFAEGSMEAVRNVLALIPKKATVGIGDSSAVRQIGLLEALRKRGLRVLNPFESIQGARNPMEAQEHTDTIAKEATICDAYVAGANAITRDGRIVNVDAVGNRVAGMFWGHPISIIIIGKNKIVENLDEAFFRIRHVIAPNHSLIKTKISAGKVTTPCAASGECTDCRSLDRKCNVFSIIESRPLRTSLNVIVVNQDLGLGWDPFWPEDRIEKIKQNHVDYCWRPAFDVRSHTS
jgi:hypothetical protein